MANFPKLKTGAVAQYPSSRLLEFSTEVRRFLDSSEQRCRDRTGVRRRWRLDLTQLDESELASVRRFVEEQRGAFATFDFEDPFSGSTVANCRLAGDVLELVSHGELDNRVRVEILETL